MKKWTEKLMKTISLTGMLVVLTGVMTPLVSVYPQRVYAADNPNLVNKSLAPFSVTYGSHYWTTSSIREWLNSDAAAGKVVYTNEPPNEAKLGKDAYDQEPGFLNEFTSAEKSGIAVTERRVFVHSSLGSAARDGGSADVGRFDGLVPSNNIHISSPNIDTTWKDRYYQVVKDKVFILGINETFEYLQKRGWSTKKGLSEEAKNLYNLNGESYTWATSTFNVSNINRESIWAYNTNGYGDEFRLHTAVGIAPALHLKPTYVLSNGKKAQDLTIGELVTFGKYHGHAIQWRVINKTDKGYPLLLAEKILTIKRYDAPGETIYRISNSINFTTADVSLKDDLQFNNGTNDETPPTIKVKDDSNLFSRQNNNYSLVIQASDTGSGVSHIILPDGSKVSKSEVTYTFTENKRYYFTAVDKAGNHYGLEIPVGNINPPASVLVTPSVNGWSNKDVNVTIQSSQEGTTKYVEQKVVNAYAVGAGEAFPNYTSYAGKKFRITGKHKLLSAVDNNYSALFRFSYNYVTKSGDHYRVATTYPHVYTVPIKNLSNTSFTSFSIDYTVPANYFSELTMGLGFTHSNNLSGQYSVEWRELKAELLDKEDFQIKKIILPSGKEVNASTYVDTLSSDGTYIYKVLDNRGKTTEKSVTVKIDKVNPTIQVTWDKNPTNGNVVLTIKATDDKSGIKQVQKPNGEADPRSSFTYNIYENGSYTFTAEDLAGNKTSVTAVVDNIDRTKPTIKIETNGNSNYAKSHSTKVTVSDDKSGIQTAQYAWSTSNTTQPSSWTNFTSGSTITTPATTGNHYLWIRAVDKAGNETIATSNLFRVDATAPTFSASPASGDWKTSAYTVTPTYGDSHSGVATRQYAWSTSTSTPSSWNTYTSGTLTQPGAGTHYLHYRVVDVAGNEKVGYVGPYRYEATKPTGTLTQTPTTPTNGNVTLNLTNVSDAGGSGLKEIRLPNGTTVTGTSASQVVTENGTYTFTISDQAGNITTLSITVSNIDKIPPNAPTIKAIPETKTNQEVVVSVHYPSDSVKNEVRINGGEWQLYQNSFTFTKNGYVIEARATDAVGNVSEIAKYVIDNIVPTPTAFIITPSNTNWTNQSVVLTIQGSEYIKTIILPNGTTVSGNKAQYTVTENGVYEFVGLNKNGRISELGTFVVKNIDRSGKKVKIDPVDQNWKNQDIPVQINIIE